MALSPKINEMQEQQPGPEQEQQLFDDSFTQMAQQTLLSNLPDIAQDVVTFKMIDSNMDSGSAVGAFIVQRPNGIIYVPCVLADNEMMPLEMMYAKESDRFLPLSREWISELDRGGVSSLGSGVKTPETLYTDVDIRNLVVPPTTGRYSYASAADLHLPEFLAASSNDAKEKFAALLKNDVSLFKVAVAIYGSKTLVEALRPTATKTAEDASKVTTPTGALYVAKRDTDPLEFTKLFGPNAPLAMRGVAVKGFYAQDGRKKLKRPVNTESMVRMQEVRSPGAYRLFKTDGRAVTALVIPRPIEFEAAFRYSTQDGPQPAKDFIRKVVPRANDYHPDVDHRGHIEYIGLTDDGECIELRNPVIGEMLLLGDLKKKALAALTSEKSPKVGEKGFWVRNRGGNHVEATQWTEVKSVSTGKDGIKRIVVCSLFDDVTVVIDPKNPSRKAILPKGERVMFLPEDFCWVPFKDFVRENELVHDPHELASAFLGKLQVEGATPVSVKAAGADQFNIDGRVTLDRVDAIIKLATDNWISVQDAEEVVKHAEDNGYCNVIVATTESLTKLGGTVPTEDGGSEMPSSVNCTTGDSNSEQMDRLGKTDKRTDLNNIYKRAEDVTEEGAAAADPEAQAQAQAMAQQQPPAPSPLDQAIAEMQDQVNALHNEQMSLMNQKEQLLSQQLAALQAVAARAQEIAQGVPKEQSQAMQSVSGPPETGIGQSQGQAQGQAQDQRQPGQPAQNGGGGTLDPSMMQQASGLADPSMFDASAVGSLAEHGSLKELTVSYMPVLEKSVDHLGRILLTLWVKTSDLRTDMGEETYTALEEKLRSLFKGMGDLVLRVSRATAVLRDGSMEHTDAQQHRMGM